MSAEQSNLSIQDEISAAILQVLRDAHSQLNCDIPTSLTLERPKNRDHGDYATSIALALSKPSGIAPRKIAEIIVAGLKARKDIAALEIAGPGFVNITLDKSSQGGVIANILAAGKTFGHGNKLNGVAINLEFISANPTGPLHLGHTRWAAVGDALGRVLSAAGAKVAREFYINDRGVQMDKFGASLQSAALGQPRPEDGYHGAYIDDLAKEVVQANPEVLKLSGEEQTFAFRDIGYKLQLAQQQSVLDKFGTHFDVWFSEKNWFRRAHALFQLISNKDPDFVCLQEVTPKFLTLLLQQSWIREKYFVSDEIKPWVTLQLKKVIERLQNPTNNFGAVSLDAINNRDAFVKKAFELAIINLKSKLGTDMNRWQYGQEKYKHVTLEHPLAHLLSPSLKEKLNIGPLPRGGNGQTPGSTGGADNQASGASFRILIDTKNWDNTLIINTPGQSGDSNSPFYRNLFSTWANDSYFPSYYSRAAIEKTVVEKWVGKP